MNAKYPLTPYDGRTKQGNAKGEGLDWEHESEKSFRNEVDELIDRREKIGRNHV